MESIMNTLRTILVASAAGCALAGSAMANTISITNVAGEWTGIVGGTNTSGVGTDSIRWGVDVGNGQSGYDFVGNAPPTIFDLSPDELFDLGTFTHRNQPIQAGTSITSATLKVVFDFIIGSDPTPISRSSTFVFKHWETPNGVDPCADGNPNGVGVNSNGCADNVDPVTNPAFSESFDVDGFTYLLDVTGFDIGSSFWTVEGENNTAKIQARFTLEENVAPIPLPAAGWLLASALLGAGAIARSRRAA
jgi:hypothetical protein